ncbi:MAG TPA: hypothetical protein VMX57_05705, partial [Planctomycetota bacterium]|nr:hypothetical protein [Planctomycetota bacterium]
MSTWRTFSMMLAALSVMLLVSPSAQAGPTNSYGWTSMGIGAGGALYDPAASPHDSKICFVSSDMGGFYRSEDAGKSWEMLDWRMITRSRAPVFHPTDANTVYAISYGGGALRVSADKGKTWRVVDGPWRGDSLRELTFDRTNPALALLSGRKGLYRSTDEGQTWKPVDGSPGGVIALLVDQTSPAARRVCFAAGADAVYRSDDGGLTWQKKTDGLPFTDLRGFCGGSDPKTNRVVVYCILPTKGGRGGVYRSTDRGETWESAMGEGINKGNDQFTFIAQAETHPDIVYVTDQGTGDGRNSYTVYRTTDAGKTWRFSYMSDPRYDFNNTEVGWLYYEASRGWGDDANGFGVNAGNPDQALYTNDGEVFITTDGAKTWYQAYSKHAEGQGAPAKGQRWSGIGLEDTSCWQYVIDPHDPKRHYICYTDIGFARSTDEGKTWFSTMPALPWRNTTYQLACDPDVPGKIWAAGSNMHDIPHWRYAQGHQNRPGGVAVTADYAKTWAKSNAGLPNAPCTAVVLDPKSPRDARTLYAAMYGYGVYKSTDGGKSWTKKSDGIEPANNRQVYRIELLKDGTLLCSVAGRRPGGGVARFTTGGIYKSTDAADSWTRISSDAMFRPVDFVVHPTDPDIIYVAAMDGMAHKGGVYKTTDGGRTWTQSVPDYDRNIEGYIEGFSVALNPKDPEIVYFTSNTHGIFLSRDGAKTWEATTPKNSPPFLNCSRITGDPA